MYQIFTFGIQTAFIGFQTNWLLQFIVVNSGLASLALLVCFAVLDGLSCLGYLVALIIFGPAAGLAIYVLYRNHKLWQTMRNDYISLLY